MQRRNLINVRHAFTLIELLLVLVILGILAAVIVPKFAGRPEQARKSRAQADVKSIETALDMFEVDNGRYPTSEEGLQALITQPGNLSNWHGSYLKGAGTKDPWGNPYVYRYPGSQNANGYDLFSTGQDGKDSSGNEINNWSQK